MYVQNRSINIETTEDVYMCARYFPPEGATIYNSYAEWLFLLI